MDRLGGILPKVLYRRGLQTQAQAAMITYRAEAWLHEQLPHFADMLRVTKLSHSELTIEATHSIAAQECQQVLEGLREHMKKESDGMVREIRIVRA